MEDMDYLVGEYVKEAKDDYLVLPQLSVAARRWLGARTTDEARVTTLELVRRLYEKGLRPGDYWTDDFIYWPDEGCQAMLDRIEGEWLAAGHDPNLGKPICWFGLPDKEG